MLLHATAGSYEYIRRFIVQLSGAEGGHGPQAPSSLPVYDLLAGSASGGGQTACDVHHVLIMHVTTHLLTGCKSTDCSVVLCHGCMVALLLMNMIVMMSISTPSTVPP